MKSVGQNNINLSGNIHMTGIGGIGMSGLAKYLKHHGATVQGSDLSLSHIIDDLIENYDIKVDIGSDSTNIPLDCELLVYSPAVPENDPERTRAMELEIPQYSYPQVLGMITENKFTIAVSGSNGKTTTTSMITELLDHLELKPNAIVGEILQKFNSNFVPGVSDYFIAEACEYKDSFLNLQHNIAVITNITADHLDYFDNLAAIQKSFVSFLDNHKGQGILVCNIQLPNLKLILDRAHELDMKVIDYTSYLTDDLEVALLGEHNKQNAAAALAVMEALDLDMSKAKDYLAHDFKGAKRRLEYIGETTHGALIFDDYAHNPEALVYLIEGLRTKYPGKKLVMLFEPHLYSRTKDFKKEFARALEKVEDLYLFATYRAREQQIPEEDYLLEKYIDPQRVNLTTIKDPSLFKEIFEKKKYGSNTLVVTAGAGDIWEKGLEIKKASIE